MGSIELFIVVLEEDRQHYGTVLCAVVIAERCAQ